MEGGQFLCVGFVTSAGAKKYEASEAIRLSRGKIDRHSAPTRADKKKKEGEIEPNTAKGRVRADTYVRPVARVS